MLQWLPVTVAEMVDVWVMCPVYHVYHPGLSPIGRCVTSYHGYHPGECYSGILVGVWRWVTGYHGYQYDLWISQSWWMYG